MECYGFRTRTRPSRISCSPRSILALNSSVISNSSSNIFPSQSSNIARSDFDNNFTCSSTCSRVGMLHLLGLSHCHAEQELDVAAGLLEFIEHQFHRFNRRHAGQSAAENDDLI